MTGQERGIDPVVTGAQQTDDGTAPDAVFDMNSSPPAAGAKALSERRFFQLP
ncbi:hypothetical protein [Cedecea sp.]|uniref:hypothetical protein n=1 Tax=Cedecea sp. TaxID=1970739 RepID=UPI003BB8D163